MATLPDETALGQRPTPRPSSGVASYRATTGMEDAQANALTTAGGEMGKAAEIFGLYMKQQDETSVNDAYTQQFSPAFRKVYSDYRATQGRDAVEQLQPAIEKMNTIRTVVRDSLPNKNQQKMFDNLATRRVEMELDIASQHANTQNKVWQIGVQKSAIQNALNTVVDAADNQFNFDNALTLGREQIFSYAAANGGIGIDGLTPQESFRHFVSDALVTKLSSLSVTNPLKAQEEINQPGVLQQIDPRHRAVLLNKIQEHAGVVMAKADAGTIIAEVRAAQPTENVVPPAAAPAISGDMFARMVQVESGGRHTDAAGNLLRSSEGALGITQVMPKTGTKPGFGVAPLKDQSREEYLRFGRDYLNAMMTEFGGDPRKAAAAYNWGPEAVKGAVAKYGDAWLDHAPAETKAYVAQVAGPAMTAVALQRDMAPDTSGMPNSHDIRAQLPIVMAKIDAKADERFGADDSNPQKIAYRTRAYVAANAEIGRVVSALDAIQKQANDTVLAAVAGQNDKPPITDMGAIMADPTLATSYGRLLPAGKIGIQHLVAQQAQAALGRPAQVNAKLEQSIFQRMLLPSDDPQAITRPDQLTPFAAQGLTMESHSRLVAKLDALKTPDGRAFEQRVEKVVRGAAAMMKSGIAGRVMADVEPEKFAQAVLAFQMDLDAKIAAYRLDPKKNPNDLLTPGKPEYVGTTENISTFLKTPAQALREGAIKVDPAAARVAVGRINGGPVAGGDEATEARKAIANGADKAAVEARYKARTGKAL